MKTLRGYDFLLSVMLIWVSCGHPVLQMMVLDCYLSIFSFSQQ